MTKFSILETGISRQDIKYFVMELKKNNLIASTEKDKNNDIVYHTHNIVAVRKIADEYEGLMVDIYNG